MKAPVATLAALLLMVFTILICAGLADASRGAPDPALKFAIRRYILFGFVVLVLGVLVSNWSSFILGVCAGVCYTVLILTWPDRASVESAQRTIGRAGVFVREMDAQEVLAFQALQAAQDEAMAAGKKKGTADAHSTYSLSRVRGGFALWQSPL